MKRTSTLNLPLFESTDKYYINDINEINESVDTAFGDLQETFNTLGTGGALTTKEVVEARGGKENLKERLNDVDETLVNHTSQLAEITNQIKLIKR